MNEVDKLLIAVGSSLTANCQPCLNTALSNALAAGATKRDILEALAIGRLVRKGAMGKMDNFVTKITGANFNGSTEECPFGSTEEEFKEWVEEEETNKPSCDCNC